MYKKILVPLDGSKRAEAILPHVEDLATRYEAAVIFLQVVEPNIIFTSPYDAYPELNMEEARLRAKEVEAYLVTLEEKFKAAGITATHRIEFGPVVLTILDVATKEAVELIALVSHGRTGLSRVFYGSVTAGVLHRVDRPLLLVRSQ